MEKINKLERVCEYLPLDDAYVVDLILHLQELVNRYGDSLTIEAPDYELWNLRVETDEEYLQRTNSEELKRKKKEEKEREEYERLKKLYG